MTSLTVDDEAMIQFEVLEVGDYKFVIQTAGNIPKEKKENSVKHWGDPHENLNGKHLKTGILTPDRSRRYGTGASRHVMDRCDLIL